MTETPRPLHHLAQLMRRYPDLPQAVDTFRAGKGLDLPDWPNWCFIPFAAWHAVAMRDATPETMLERAGDIAILGALAPWRYTQGIYRFDADLLDELVTTPLGSILPAAVLLRLPQWSVYVELPPERCTWLGAPLHGFWASLEWDAGETDHGRHELRLLLDTDNGLPAGILHLGPWTVQESVRRAVAEAERVAASFAPGARFAPDLPASMAADIVPLLNLLLYLCADEPEIDDEREPGASPGSPQPRRVKAGLRLFPPDKPTHWRVGEATGQQLRAAASSSAPTEAGAEQRTVRTHIRRGHWHGYWTGPRAPERAAERGFVYHWLHPLIVSGSTQSAAPQT